MKKLILVLLAFITAGLLYAIWQRFKQTSAEPISSLITLPVEAGTDHFARAVEPGGISFPEDFGPHNDFQTEWWYYTGNLENDDQRPFGFQLTFFRRALPNSGDAQTAVPPEEPSRWTSNQIYMAHFTISDIEEDQFYANERLSRGVLGLAGAQSAPYRVWLSDWSVEKISDDLVSLSASTGDVAVRLNLEQRNPPILHGIDGLSQKGPEPGNASYYYSITGQGANGEIDIGATTYRVKGTVWKDHEYGTSALVPDAVGWDWYSLQLDDGSALMFFEIRREDGSLEPLSSGTYIDPQGVSTPLEFGDWQVDVLDQWTSLTSGATYPAAWTISVPDIDLVLTGRPLMAGQELNLSTTYWEGAVSFEGTVGDRPAAAKGYIEMTGYAEPLTGRF